MCQSRGDPGPWGGERSESSSEQIKVAIRVGEISEGENIGEEGDKRAQVGSILSLEGRAIKWRNYQKTGRKTKEKWMRTEESHMIFIIRKSMLTSEWTVSVE